MISAILPSPSDYSVVGRPTSALLFQPIMRSACIISLYFCICARSLSTPLLAARRHVDAAQSAKSLVCQLSTSSNMCLFVTNVFACSVDSSCLLSKTDELRLHNRRISYLFDFASSILSCGFFVLSCTTLRTEACRCCTLAKRLMAQNKY